MQTNLNPNTSNIMPLMMNFTQRMPIEEIEHIRIKYSDAEQITIEDRIVGTRCLRRHRTENKKTHTANYSDGKNEIDDSKTVK